MSRSPAARQRPLSPHLTAYKWPMTMTMSIMHRITGGALYFGMVLVAWWLLAAATSPQWFETANWVMGSWFGILVLIGFTWSLYLHALGGIRHFLWDTGYAIDKHTATQLAWATLAGSLVLTAATFAALFLLV